MTAALASIAVPTLAAPPWPAPRTAARAIASGVRVGGKLERERTA